MPSSRANKTFVAFLLKKHNKKSHNTRLKSNKFIWNHELSECCSFIRGVGEWLLTHMMKERRSESSWYQINLLDFNLVLFDFLLCLAQSNASISTSWLLLWHSGPGYSSGRHFAASASLRQLDFRSNQLHDGNRYRAEKIISILIYIYFESN